MITDTSTPPDVCALVLESKSDQLVVLAVPGTNYRLHLLPTLPAAAIATAVGKRIRGRIRGTALRVHVASAGGRFIEPVYGHPRIVQGTVAAVDAERNRLLVDIVVPMLLDLTEGQRASDFAPGQMVNMYVSSGMTFTPE